MTDPGQYDHPRLGTLQAVKPGEYPGPVPAMADWAVTAGDWAIGYITDSRAGNGQPPSLSPPAREEDTPFGSFDLHGQPITRTNSVTGALLAIGNRAAGLPDTPARA
jgi:hypothetical protein